MSSANGPSQDMLMRHTKGLKCRVEEQLASHRSLEPYLVEIIVGITNTFMLLYSLPGSSYVSFHFLKKKHSAVKEAEPQAK